MTGPWDQVPLCEIPTSIKHCSCRDYTLVPATSPTKSNLAWAIEINTNQYQKTLQQIDDYRHQLCKRYRFYQWMSIVHVFNFWY